MQEVLREAVRNRNFIQIYAYVKLKENVIFRVIHQTRTNTINTQDIQKKNLQKTLCLATVFIRMYTWKTIVLDTCAIG